MLMTIAVIIATVAVVFALFVVGLGEYLEDRKYDKYNNAQAAIGRKVDVFALGGGDVQYWIKQWVPPPPAAPSWNRYGLWYTIDKYYSAIYDPVADRVDCGCFHGTLEQFHDRIRRKVRAPEALSYYLERLRDFKAQETQLKEKLPT